MGNGAEMIRWAARVSPANIRRLYESYAREIVDGDLLDDIAYGFYARCESILTIKAAKEGRVKCPSCGHVIVRVRSRKSGRRVRGIREAPAGGANAAREGAADRLAASRVPQDAGLVHGRTIPVAPRRAELDSRELDGMHGFAGRVGLRTGGHGRGEVGADDVERAGACWEGAAEGASEEATTHFARVSDLSDSP